MLKFIFLLAMLIPCSKNWKFVQAFLLLFSFLVAIYCFHDFYMFNVGMGLGLDYFSYIMVLLSIWVTMLMLLASQKISNSIFFPGSFVLVTLFLCFFLVITFSSLDYLLFYIMFESSLIPILVLILGWGYQPERIQAGIYMLFYTLFASLPLLVSFLSLYSMGGSSTMGVCMKIATCDYISAMWYISTVFAFMVKLPVYFFHVWLPKAHVEAPVAGSMVLAGVLLKLGGYGLLRVLPLFVKANKAFSSLWVSLGILGGLVVSIMCLRQTDMKSLIAYSSVAHMGLVLCGLMVSNSWGLGGGMVVMVGHGLCSSGLFCIANMVYERTKSRSLLVSKGLLNFMPNLGLWWFLLSIGNMAAPPSLNLLGEISLLVSLIGWSKMTMMGVALLSFFSAAYTLYLYSLSQHGIFFSSLFSCCSGKVLEFLVLMLHWFPLNVLILKGYMMVPLL